MTADEIKVEIKNFIFGFIRNQELEDDVDMFVSGYVNSLFAMQLVLFIEKKFNFIIENNDLKIENFKSINAISCFVNEKMK
jgi:acyl carrier protein